MRRRPRPSTLILFGWDHRKVVILNDVNSITLFDQDGVVPKEFLDFRGSEALGFGED